MAKVLSQAVQSENTAVELALVLLQKYRSNRAQSLNIVIDAELEDQQVSYTEDSLHIPDPSTLNHAMFTIQYASLLYENQFDPTNVPNAFASQVQQLVDLIEREYVDSQSVSASIEIDDKGIMKIPYRYVDVNDSAVTFILLKNQVEIHTTHAMLVKQIDEGAVTKQLIDEADAKYDPQGFFKVRLKKRLVEKSGILAGTYRVYPR